MKIKRIDQVTPGDEVLTSEGIWHKVTDTRTIPAHGKRHTLTMWGGAGDVVLTGNHPVLTPKGFVPAGDIQSGDVLLERIDETVHDVALIDMLEFFTRSKSEKKSRAGLYLGGVVISPDGMKLRYKNPKARWVNRWIPVNEQFLAFLGYYAAEGSCGAHNVQFTFHSEELEYHREIRDLVSGLFGLELTDSPSKISQALTLTVSSHPLRELVRALVPGTSGEKGLNELILHADSSLQRAFLRTYWNGDGSHHNQGWLFTTTSRTLMLQIRTMLLRQKIAPTLSTSRRAGKEVVISGHKTTQRYDLLNLRIERAEQYLKFSEIVGIPVADKADSTANKSKVLSRFTDDGFLALTVKSVVIEDWSEESTVTNLTVDGDPTFTLPSVTTHNCDSLAIGLIVAEEYQVPEVTFSNNPFYTRN